MNYPLSEVWKFHVQRTTQRQLDLELVYWCEQGDEAHVLFLLQSSKVNKSMDPAYRDRILIHALNGGSLSLVLKIIELLFQEEGGWKCHVKEWSSQPRVLEDPQKYHEILSWIMMILEYEALSESMESLEEDPSKEKKRF